MDKEIINHFQKILLERPGRIFKDNGEIVEIYDQPERLSPETRKGCDSLNSAVTSREQSEEVAPPDDVFKCAKCEMSFDPCDWQDDICDNCLYHRIRS